MKGDGVDKITAFRVCVPAEQRADIMNVNLWVKGTISREWKFTKKPSQHNGTQH